MQKDLSVGEKPGQLLQRTGILEGDGKKGRGGKAKNRQRITDYKAVGKARKRGF